jgi:hypothetical protein
MAETLFKKGDLITVIAEVEWAAIDSGDMKIMLGPTTRTSVYLRKTDAVMHRAVFEVGDLVNWDRASGGWTYTGTIKSIDADDAVAWIVETTGSYHTVDLASLRRPDPDFDEIPESPPEKSGEDPDRTTLDKVMDAIGSFPKDLPPIEPEF